MSVAVNATSPAERLATVAVFFANGLGIGAWAVSVPAFKAQLSLSPGALSLVLLAFAIGAVVSMPIAGLIAPRLGTGLATRLSFLLFAGGLLVTLAGGSLPALAAAAAVLGIVNGAMDVAMNAHASSVERRWGAAIMSSFHAAFSAGGLTGAAVGAALTAAGSGARGIMASGAAAAVLIAAASWPALGQGDRSPGGAGLALPGRAALPLCAVALLCMLCEGAMVDWSAVYLATVAEASPGAAASGYASFSAAMVAGRLAGDRVVRMLGRGLVVAGGGTVAAAGLILAASWPAPWVASAGFALVGIGLSNIVPVVFSAAGRLGGSPSAGIAMAATAGYAGFLAGPPAIGGLAEAAGLRAGIVLLAACAGAVALIGSRRARLD